MEKSRAHFMATRPDQFYDEISDDRLDELKEQAIDPRKLKSDNQLR